MIYLLAVPIFLAGAFCFCAYYSFAYGYVASCIWAWFLVPMGLPSLSWKACAAALMLVSMMRASATDSGKKAEASDVWGKLIGLAIAPWFVLLVAWFIRN